MRKKVISNQEKKTRDELISGKSFGRAAVIAMSLALCTVTGLTLTACGSSSDAKGPGGMRPGIASGGAAGFDGEDGERPNFADGEKPDGAPDGEMPQPPDGERPDFANGERPEGAPEGEPPDGERPDFADGERPEGAPDGGPSGGEMPDRPNGEDTEEA